MNVTKHFKRRYAQRIKNVKGKEEISLFVTTNQDKISEDAKKMMEHAIFIWKGQLGETNITRNFYINGDIILVADTDNTALVTLYKTDYGYPAKTNRMIAKDLLENIQGLSAELEVAELAVKEELDKVDLEIDSLDVQLKSLKAQAEAIESQKKAKISERKSLFTRTRKYTEEIEKFAKMLCNSIEYKVDVKEM
ncbi:hypothetical protein QUF96_03190 [Bacillus bombysepticus]|uniref:hypothetical protein n=1 Tax=Bacillus anthracis TaxID=1392 RepID=UPI0033120741|nr:hypothetical protein [Bacillus bombysepticus]HDR4373513.1 hypothetical protein [Bacillus cereus]